MLVAVCARMPGLTFHLRARRLDLWSSDSLSRAGKFDASGALGRDRRRRAAHGSNSSPRLCASASGVRIIRASSPRFSRTSGETGVSPILTTRPLGIVTGRDNPLGFGYGRSRVKAR